MKDKRTNTSVNRGYKGNNSIKKGTKGSNSLIISMNKQQIQSAKNKNVNTVRTNQSKVNKGNKNEMNMKQKDINKRNGKDVQIEIVSGNIDEEECMFQTFNSLSHNRRYSL